MQQKGLVKVRVPHGRVSGTMFFVILPEGQVIDALCAIKPPLQRRNLPAQNQAQRNARPPERTEPRRRVEARERQMAVRRPVRKCVQHKFYLFPF